MVKNPQTPNPPLPRIPHIRQAKFCFGKLGARCPKFPIMVSGPTLWMFFPYPPLNPACCIHKTWHACRYSMIGVSNWRQRLGAPCQRNHITKVLKRPTEHPNEQGISRLLLSLGGKSPSNLYQWNVRHLTIAKKMPSHALFLRYSA